MSKNLEWRTTPELQKLIITQKDANIRIYKNINNPQNYQRLKDLKYPIIIEILSNAPIHIMNQIIKNNIILKKVEKRSKKQ